MCLKKQQLDVEPDLEFLLFGLVSSQKASKVCFFLNQIANLNLERVEDFKLPDYNPASKTSFSKFAFSDEENHLLFSVLANKEFGLCLFSDLKQFDFLLILRGGLEFFDPKKFIEDLRVVDDIQLLVEIENDKIKSKLSWIV